MKPHLFYNPYYTSLVKREKVERNKDLSLL
jgi:hypothetical protein